MGAIQDSLLILDQNPRSRQQIRRLLCRNNYVTTAFESVSAFRMRATDDYRFDLAIVDSLDAARELYSQPLVQERKPPILLYTEATRGLEQTAGDFRFPLAIVKKSGARSPILTRIASLLADRNHSTSGGSGPESNGALRSKEWDAWRKVSDARRLIQYGVRLVGNLRHSISQGRGVGSLVTMVEFLQMQRQNGEGNYIIPADLAKTLIEDAEHVRGWLSAMEHFSLLEKLRFENQPLSTMEIVSIVENAAARVEKFQSVRNHSTQIEAPGPRAGKEIQFQGNPAAIGLAIRELLTNAYKYSPADSLVQVAWFMNSEHLSIAILNDIDSELSDSWSEDAFVPFARGSNILDDRYLEEELPLGVGLPVIREAIQQNGGFIELRNIKDHSDCVGGKSRVMAMIFLKRLS